MLDSVTTLVDANHFLLRVADSREALEQVAFADQIVLNKTDLVSLDALEGIEAQLRKINPLAPIHRAQRANVALEKILGRGGFELARIVSLEPDFMQTSSYAANSEAGHVHDEHCGHGNSEHDHVHDTDIASVALVSHVAMDRARLSAWLTQLVATQGQHILRAKGIIDIQNEPRRLVIQAVHMLLEGDLQTAWKPDEPRVSRLVFIGRNLDKASLQAGFDSCVADSSRETATDLARSISSPHQPALIQ